MEGVSIGDVVNKHNHISFGEQFHCDFLEDVLPRNVNQMELNCRVSSLNADFLDVVLTTLSHVVVVIECALNDVVH